ncbi:M20/M25/M40 family metallo-hydrolase [Alicyclobacillus acidoterrestris]|uniref:M20/M25/M40 family metallo-hydrolase n=1 Tax=Alicyclobacillus acidoterrestris (strain ATCC 49025 / DSM 3922 / CIP 106132 / NCIMB 13137 / GD3B) TaxID=1356854 RepID=T0D6J4_ALIAG|nr:M20/M25/M40 family metallo-hydrolase [Alicyclobacillus acidoterrestris]EPZ45396.1 hypothetical protein N007_08980 [Alicyclobacillus acidoterrestris ATCC 49025]UNO48426.1 M20/M25/M40 family metallo-hydrolase [Alicyclobacillus acidoterrestris]
MSTNQQVSSSSLSKNDLSQTITDRFDVLLSQSSIQQALSFIEADSENTLQEQIAITAIPAPSFQEDERGRDYKRRLEELGLVDVTIDEEGNVFGRRPGVGDGPVLFVSSHLDTVFPAGTDTVARERDGRYYAPGISDNGRGLAGVLAILRALNHAGIQTQGDLIFGATVGEEGVGDLRGAKAFFRHHADIDGFISIEPGEPSRTTYLATGSRRYRVTYQGKGGHSYGDFGIPSAIHALGRAIAMIAEVKVPADPKTTFTVGEISGGTSVNTIAATATMLVDMRSSSQEELARLEEQVLQLIEQAAVLENERWGARDIQVHVERIGDRPGGAQSADAPIVQASLAASLALGDDAILDDAASTDSNVPISLRIPAVTLGGGGISGGLHTLEEFFDPTDAHKGIQKIFLTVVGLVGVADVVDAILPKRV